MKKNYSYIYIVGYGNKLLNFNIRYIADTKEKALTKIKKYIKEIKEGNDSEEEKQNFLKTLQIREYCINDDYCSYGIINI